MYVLFVLLNILFFLMIASLRMIKLLVLGLRSLKIYLILPFIFISCQIVLVRCFWVNRSERVFKEFFFFNITRDPRVYKSEDCGDAGKFSAVLSDPAWAWSRAPSDMGGRRSWAFFFLKILQCHVLSLLFCRTLLILVGALHKGFIRAI